MIKPPYKWLTFEKEINGCAKMILIINKQKVKKKRYILKEIK